MLLVGIGMNGKYAHSMAPHLPPEKTIFRNVRRQIEVFHMILDCVSDTAAAEMRAAYKVGFKDGVALMREIQIVYCYYGMVLSLCDTRIRLFLFR